MTRAGVGGAQDKRTNVVRRWFEDMGTFMVAAVVLLVVGSLFLFAGVQSTTMLQWTGTAVQAKETGGIAYYSFHGQNYTLDVTSPYMDTGTVYLDPADPSDAMFSNPLIRWAEVATVGGPFAASVLLVTFGFARRSRRRRLEKSGPQLSFGKGLDHGTLGRLLERQREAEVRNVARRRMATERAEHRDDHGKSSSDNRRHLSDADQDDHRAKGDTDR